jgi:hypothetical protein
MPLSNQRRCECRDIRITTAAKEWSGTKADLKKKQQKIDKLIRAMLARHRENDAANRDVPAPREQKSLDRLRAKVRKIKAFLATHEENRGPKGMVADSRPHPAGRSADQDFSSR